MPVSSALVGAILAVAALCATAVFGASLTHLTETPSQYGRQLDAWLSVNGTGSPTRASSCSRRSDAPASRRSPPASGAPSPSTGRRSMA